MEIGKFDRKVRGHWLTRKPDPKSSIVALGSVLVLIFSSFFFWSDIFGASTLMTAIPQNVFVHHEYWRLWTALFAHADTEHLLSNSLLFSAFAYLLYGHFGKWVFPAAAIFFGGVTNFIVLTTMPPEASLLGVSGVVYWMGAAWLTLYFLLESRDKFSKRAVKAIGVGAVLLLPETFHPNVSYLSHSVGFGLGMAWAICFYAWNRQRFLNAEIIELVSEDLISAEPFL